MTNFVFADKEDLSLLYRKISKCFSKYQTAIDDVYAAEISANQGRVSDTWDSGKTYAANDTTVFGGNAYQALSSSTNQRPDLSASWKILTTTSREFDYRIQENRIVGPLADTIELDDVTVTEPTPGVGVLSVVVKTKINHGFFPGQYVAIANTGFSTLLEGVFEVINISTINPKEFTYRAYATLSQVSFASGQTKVPNANATVQAEIDSVESASPYVFNVSIRSTWGICGIWADGKKATGFKSMVIAQYTGVSLQKDDRAFIRYDEFTNTWNQAPLTDAFASTPYHIKGDAYWKDDWRNFHVRASDDSFIQNVSIFAVGFADHFLLESGGDMSITNSNSNFGNTSMHSKGFKGFAFNQDKGGYITDIIPPQAFTSTPTVVNTSYYSFDVQLTRADTTLKKLYIAGDTSSDYLNRPAASINGYKLGARTYINSSKAEKIYTKISADTANGETNPSVKEAYIYPQGFKKWSASLTTLNPDGLGIGNFDNNPLTNEVEDLVFYNRSQDAANLIDLNKTFIQAEAFGYVIEKYPYLQNKSYINPNIDGDTGRYRDASNLIRNNRQEIINYAFSQMQTAFPTFTVPGGIDANDKCKRDIGYIIDALAADLYDGGNSHMVDATKAYFDSNGALITNGVLGEQTQSIFAFNRTRDWAKKAISNLLPSTSLLSVTSITRSGTTVTVNVNPAAPHGLKAGDVVTIGGATQSGYNGKWTVLSTGLTTTAFTVTVTTTPAASPATGAPYVSTVTIDVKNSLAEAGRYKDASKLVTANRQEIIDRAFAEIAVQYTESGWGTNWVVPGDTVTTNLSRYFDAYRLIQKNKQIIIETAYATVVASPPSPAPTDLLNKCKRDIGYFVDAVSLDLLLGSVSSSNGNKYTRKFLQQYFNAAGNALTSDGLAGEVTQSNTAFQKARDAMNAAVTNLLSNVLGVVTSSPAGGTWQDGSTGTKTVYTDLTISPGPATYGGGGVVYANTSFQACADVTSAINSLTLLVTTSLTGGNITSLVAESNGISEGAGELKCMRDIGYIVDSIAQDLFWGGNEFTVGAVREYFNLAGTPISNGLVGETTQSVIAFNAARDMVNKAVTNQLYSKNLSLSYGPAQYSVGGTTITYGNSGNAATCIDVQNTVTTLFTIVTNVVSTGTLDSLPLVDNGDFDCANVRQSIDTLTSILTVSLSSGNLANLPARNEGKWSQVSEASKCKRDIGYIVEAITSDLRLGGNDNTINAGESYFTGTGNFTVNGTLGSISGLTAIITGISSTAELLAGMSVTKTTGAGAFGDNATIKTVDSISQITVQISSGTFTAGAITFKANRLDYIQNERVETLDAYNYVKQLMISSMRNHNTYIPTVSLSTSSSIVTLTGGKTTDGLVVGMKVQSVAAIPEDTGSNPLTNYNDALEQIVDGRVVPKTTNITSAIATGTYIKKIISSTQFELGQYGSKLSNGLTKLPTSNGSANLFFSLESGSWSTSLEPSVDNTVIQIHTQYGNTGGECANIKTALDNYFSILGNVINNGVGSVDRIPSVITTSTFAQRATLFTLSATGAPTDPHYLETGTPVRLVPRAKEGKTVDKRLIRLPRGFNTNQIYYVIAPGRKTDPYNYSTTTAFNAQAGSLQNIMLATSVENAAAGIFIYSSETEAVDQDVEIDVYQYVLDVSYDLNKYETTVDSTNLEILVTTEPHVFDIPTSADTTTDTQKYQAVFFKEISSGFPTISGGSSLNANREYYVRYVDKYSFKIYTTLAGAVAGSSPITFTSGFSGKFYTLSNKRRSPLRYDAVATTSTNTKGNWYLMTDPDKITIPSLSLITRINRPDFATKDKTPDSYFQRLEDNRSVQDRVYRLRYVIPKYLQAVRDPLRGFVIKSRTDSTRKILPQKILLKPTTSTGNSFAKFSIFNLKANAPGFPSVGREYLGLDINSQGPGFISSYDAYNTELKTPSEYLYRVKVTTDSKITFYVQSAKKKTISGKDFLELTVFDIGIETLGYKQKIFTTVKISAPQGGDGVFIENTDNTATNNTITWIGATQGSAKVHAYFAYEGQHYLILKDVNTITSTLRYSPFTTTTFSQGSITATLLSEPDFGRSLKENNLYVTEGANVYTMTPGDTLLDDTGVSYTIASVEDVEDFENTFYIYDVDTIRKRIYGQQDGIYYLTCVRGNISPYPTGSGVGENFRGYKFSQPISKLYPEFYKDDPEWYKQLDASLIDPPATVSAADNYIHGLVTVNDAKGSTTKEAILDFVQDTGSKQYNFSGNITKDGKVIDVAIKAQEGTASAGSEGRKIPISGNSLYPTEGRLYVELRRPSIARSGNHTFEYLGFGPGNYSTGFPIRQEVVLTDVQDFYAQAKRENGGIVFYTGLNSNGDLYIGNRKINAITGEETFLESATLVTSSDAGDLIANQATTFDGPVTFNDKVSFIAPISRGPITFETPIDIDIPATIPGSPTNAASPASITIRTNLQGGDNGSLTNNTKTGISYDITLTGNRIKSAVYQFNPRGLQSYSVRTAIENWTPNQLNPSQTIDFGSIFPLVSGDILLKGEQVGFTGSLGWIYANNFATISNGKISTITGYGIGQNKIRINWGLNGVGGTYTNADIGISSNYQFRISGTFTGQNAPLNSKIRGTWSIISTGFSPGNTYVDIQLNDYVETGTYSNISSESQVVFSYSNNSWKEVGVIGAEAIRTETDSIGNYKIGINTVARAATSAYLTGFVDPATTTPRANLDLVGTAFISGKTQPSGSSFETSTTKTETGVENGFLVGGYSSSPSRIANLRVDTLNNRVGINTTKSQNVFVVARSGNVATITTSTAHGYSTGDSVIVNISGSTYNTFNGTVTVLASPAPTATTFSYSNSGIVVAATNLPSGTTGTVTKPANDLDRSFVVVGNARITGDFMFESDINVNGGDITTTSTSFNLLNENTLTGTLNFANYIQTGNLFNSRTGSQTINIGNSSTNSIVRIGNTPDNAGISQVVIGGYNSNATTSSTTINSKYTNIAGNIIIGNRLTAFDTLTVLSNAGTVNFLDGVNTVSFAPTSVNVSLGGQGGNTKINNALLVDASITSNGSITLNGGLSSFNFNGQRGQFGTTVTTHNGTPSGVPAQNNVDIVRVVAGTSLLPLYYTNYIDTSGAGEWGSPVSYRDATIVTGALDLPNVLPPLTNPKHYYLPLNSAPTYLINDYLIIKDSNTNKTYEIVRVVATPRINSAPYYIVVERQPTLGTTSNPSFLPLTSGGNTITHAQGVSVVKATINFRATWITGNIDNTGGTDAVSLAEFGGGLSVDDFIIVDRNDSGTTGEIIKINSSSGSTERKLSVNNGGGVNVFEIGSSIGNTIIGNPSLLTASGNVTTYGNLNIYTRSNGSGGYNSINTYNDIEISQVTFPTLSFDPYYGNLTLGSSYASIFAVRAALGSSAAYHDTSKTVYVYEQDPVSTQSVGPSTTTRAVIETNSTSILIQNNAEAFSKGDLIAVGDIGSPGPGGLNIPSLRTATNFEIMVITGDPITTTNAQSLPVGITGDYPSGGRAREGTSLRTFQPTYVVKINKKTITTTLLKEITIDQTYVESPNTNNKKIRMVLKNGDLIRTKLDFFNIIKIDNEFFVPDSKAGAVSSGEVPKPKEYFGGGKITTNDSVVINSGSLVMYGSDSKTRIFSVANDDGHPGDGSLQDEELGLSQGLYLKGQLDINGGISVSPDRCIEYGKLINCGPTFEVVGDDGSTRIGAKLVIDGQARPSADANLEIFKIKNLGDDTGIEASNRTFTMYQDCSVDAFGIKQFWNANGGRRWTYVNQSNSVGNELLPNASYLIDMPSSGNMVLYLPPYEKCQTGDMIRFIELSGKLTFNTSLIIRASKNGTDPVAIQGDVTGTKAESGTAVRTTSWDSGELVVQTRNAAFGLLFVGTNDAYNASDSNNIPFSLRGWWLVEL
jgi:hypothetical protein